MFGSADSGKSKDHPTGIAQFVRQSFHPPTTTNQHTSLDAALQLGGINAVHLDEWKIGSIGSN